MIAQGTFEVTMKPEPPFHDQEGVRLARATVEKTFSGSLTGHSTVWMMSARADNPGSAGYVALEHVQATLEGKTGGFVVLHQATMHQGQQSMSLLISPGSGTGQLCGLAGSMTLKVEGGQHSYVLDYTLP